MNEVSSEARNSARLAAHAVLPSEGGKGTSLFFLRTDLMHDGPAIHVDGLAGDVSSLLRG